jgi:hypothetical protein
MLRSTNHSSQVSSLSKNALRCRLASQFIVRKELLAITIACASVWVAVVAFGGISENDHATDAPLLSVDAFDDILAIRFSADDSTLWIAGRATARTPKEMARASKTLPGVCRVDLKSREERSAFVPMDDRPPGNHRGLGGSLGPDGSILSVLRVEDQRESLLLDWRFDAEGTNVLAKVQGPIAHAASSDDRKVIAIRRAGSEDLLVFGADVQVPLVLRTKSRTTDTFELPKSTNDRIFFNAHDPMFGELGEKIAWASVSGQFGERSLLSCASIFIIEPSPDGKAVGVVDIGRGVPDISTFSLSVLDVASGVWTSLNIRVKNPAFNFDLKWSVTGRYLAIAEGDRALVWDRGSRAFVHDSTIAEQRGILAWQNTTDTLWTLVGTNEVRVAFPKDRLDERLVIRSVGVDTADDSKPKP